MSRDQLWFIRCNFCVWVTKQWQTCPPCPTIPAGLRKIITSPPKSLVAFLFRNRGDHNNITPHGTRISSHLTEAFAAESNKSFFYIFVRRFHRNRGWWAQTALCNGVQGRRRLVSGLYSITVCKRAALDLTHPITVIFLGKQHLQLGANFLSWWLQLLLWEGIQWSF